MSHLTKPVHVRFCKLPDSLYQTFDPATCRRTEFQVNRLKEISELPDFDRFILVHGVTSDFQMIDAKIIGVDHELRFWVSWFDTAGLQRSEHLGLDRLEQASGPSQTAVLPDNALVYWQMSEKSAGKPPARELVKFNDPGFFYYVEGGF